MTIRRLVQVMFATLAFVAIAAAALIAFAVKSRRDLVVLQQQRLSSYQLANELRQSSTDLTRFARLYVVTGDPKFAQYYGDVLAIRQGTKPRPQHYERVYWDLFLGEGKPPYPDGPAIPLQQMMRQAGFSESELTLLRDAESESNQLVAIEQNAMHAVRGEFRDASGQFTRRGAPDRALAMRLMNDSAYSAEKARIMRPIDAFLAAVEERTSDAWNNFTHATQFFFTSIEALLAVFLLLVFASYPILRSRILVPVTDLQRQTQEVARDLDRLATAAREIAQGDLRQSYSVGTAPIKSLRPDEIGDLSRLHDEMIGQLQSAGASIATITVGLKRAHEISRQRFVAIFQESPVPLTVSSLETGKILEANRALLDLVGAASADEVLNKTGAELGFWSDTERRKTLLDPLRHSGRVEGTHGRLRNLKGEERVIEIFATYYTADDVPYVLASTIDITDRLRAEDERRRAEAQFRALVDGVRDVVFALAPDGTIQMLNPEFERTTGFRSADWIGRQVLDLVHPDDRDRALSEIGSALAGTPVDGPPMRILNAKGHFFSEIQTAPRIEDGKVVGVLGIGRNVSERMTLEEQLRQSQKMDAMGRLAGGIAHDFNNLLTVIIGFGQLLLVEAVPGQSSTADIQEMVKAAERAADMTRQLLMFSRKQVVEKHDLNLGTVLTGIERMLKRMIGDDLTLKTEHAADLGNIRADAGQIEQIVANLSVNARDAMPTGGTITITTANVAIAGAFVAAHPEARPGDFVRLSFGDSGTGMSKETVERIFEPFFTTKEVGKGTGLGLSTVFGIVEQSEGFIIVDSQLGRGTTFHLYFPLVLPEKVAAVTTRISAPEGGHETILIAEDNEALRELMTRALRAHGYTVLSTSRPEEALETAERHNGTIDLLLTDVVMPGMSGRVLAEGVSRVRPGVRVLYASGYPDEVLGRHGVLEAGVRFLAKPFTPESLAARVREVLDGAA